jgi:glycosyltransferase involved in cell wall biosynthesis
MTGRLRVLQVTHDLGVGGLPRVVETLCRTIDRTRFDVSVLCLNHGGELADALRADGFEVSVIGPVKRKTEYSVRVGRFLKAGGHEIVHSHNSQPFFDAAFGAMLARTPVLIHTDHARDFPDRLRYMVLEHLFSWKAHRVVGVSDHTTENLHRYEWIPRRKLVTIPNGIDGRLFNRPFDRARVRRSLGVPEDATVAVLGARLEAQKDIPTLLDAMQRLVPELPSLHLVIAGDGPLREDLLARRDALGLRDRVHFVGVRLDMPDILRSSDLFVLSSVWEGLPMVILEALAAGCPPVAAAVGGVPTAVLDEQTGLLVPPGDVVSLARGIRRMATDSPLRQRLAEGGKRLFTERFSAESMARRYEALYDEGMRRHGTR